MGLPALVVSEYTRDDIQLGREITLLSSQMNVGNYRLLKLIAEFDNRGGWRCGGAMRSCAHWLAARCGLDIGAAREKVRVARRLAGLPEVDQAFSTGELSYSKVRAITRVATENNENFMLTMAEQASASHLEKLVAKYKPVDEFDVGPSGRGLGSETWGLGSKQGQGTAADDGVGSGAGVAAEADTGEPGESASMCDESRREHARELFWFQDKDGMWVIHAKLPPEQGQLVMKALEAFARPLQEERQDEWKATQKARLQQVAREISRRHRSAKEREEKISAETCEVQSEEESSSGEALQTGRRVFGSELRELERASEKISAETFSQFMNHVRADAFSAMAEHFLATSANYSQFQGLKGAERCQVVLHVDVNTLREQRSGMCCTHTKGHFEHKPWLAPETARRLSCDASLVTVLEDDAGNVLNVGRRSRIVPANIRRALIERDGVCRYPDCHESRYVDAHHVKHWADGGETSLDNLVTLCRFHHRQLHRGLFDIHIDAAGAVKVEVGGRS